MLRPSKRACCAVARRRRVNVPFDDELGIGQRDFQFGKMFSRLGQLGKHFLRARSNLFNRNRPLAQSRLGSIAGCPSGKFIQRSFQQRSETCLLEMFVTGESLGNPLVAHDHE